LEQAAQAAGLLIGSAAIALSVVAAAAPPVALGVFAVAVIGGLVVWLVSPTKTEPPAPPELVEISNAVRHVVADEIDKNNAELAATQFAKAFIWVITAANSFRINLKPDGTVDLSKHDLKDFTTDLEHFRLRGDFQTWLLHMKAHPEQSKYIIPALLMGVAAQLDIQYLHAMLRQSEEPNRLVVTSIEIQHFRDEVTSCRAALQKARDAWVEHCDQEVAKHDLSNAPIESGWIKAFLTKAVTGKDNLVFLDETFENLDDISAKCLMDMQAMDAGGKPRYFLKPEWYPKIAA
jgi:hypothetical protein